MTPARLAWTCFFVIILGPFVNAILGQALPTLSKGALTALLWIFTDVIRLFELAAIVGLIVSAVWAIRRRKRTS